MTPLDQLPVDLARHLRQFRAACLAVQSGDLRGCCGHVSTMIAGLFGGRIIGGRVNGEPHYWNRLPCGVEVDLTSCQFGGDGFTPLASGRAVKTPSPVAPEVLAFGMAIQEAMSTTAANASPADHLQPAPNL